MAEAAGRSEQADGGQLVVGLGNRLRGDDGAGLEAARLIGAAESRVDVVELEREPSDLLGIWPGYGTAVVIDAVTGDEPGRIWRFEGGGELPASFRAGRSTHSIGLGDVIELGRELGRMPDRLTVVGIEGSRFTLGATMEPAVREAARRVAATFLAEHAGGRSRSVQFSGPQGGGGRR